MFTWVAYSFAQHKVGASELGKNVNECSHNCCKTNGSFCAHGCAFRGQCLASLAAGNAQAGEAQAMVCASCHGQDGASAIDPSYPQLAGQNERYQPDS